MVLFRALGWVLLAMAVAAIVNDCLTWWAEGAFRLLSLGDLWSRLAYGSFHGTEVLIDQHVSSGLWRFGFRPVLDIPALPVLAALGAFFLWYGRQPARRRTAAARGATVGARPPRRRRSRSGIS